MPDWITKDFYWKAFSLLMAIGIWLTVRRESEAQTAMPPNLARNAYHDISVVAVSANADVHQAKLDPPTVTATISGSPDVLNRLTRDEIHAFVNLTGFNSAQDLQQNVEIALPTGATIYSIEPSTVTVTLSKP